MVADPAAGQAGVRLVGVAGCPGYESGGSRRQNALAAALGWDRTRLSHLLTRMANRDYVDRDKVPNGVRVALRPEGRRVVDATLPALDAATRQHLVDRLGTDGARTLRTLVDRLLSSETDS